jgi:hypothetical protein
VGVGVSYERGTPVGVRVIRPGRVACQPRQRKKSRGSLFNRLWKRYCLLKATFLLRKLALGNPLQDSGVGYLGEGGRTAAFERWVWGGFRGPHSTPSTLRPTPEAPAAKPSNLDQFLGQSSVDLQSGVRAAEGWASESLGYRGTSLIRNSPPP